jgi:myo-inositol-1(or 4)-monophosphatase
LPANDFLALREPLVTVLRAAGDIARATARGPFKRWTKGADHSPVTEADIAVNEFLRDRLSDLVRDAGWKSEEVSPGPTQSCRAACVDSRSNRWHAGVYFRNADWSISVALAGHGRPLIATVYAPITDEMFLALRGQGAWLNSLPIKASAGATLAGARLAGPKRFLDRLAPSTRG